MFALLLEEQLFQKAFEYVVGNIDLRELEEWLLPTLETILDCGSDDSIALAELIEAGTIELQTGISTEETLIQELKELLSSPKYDQNVIWAKNTAKSTKIWAMGVLDETQTLNWNLQFA